MDTNENHVVLGTLPTGEQLCLWQADRRRHLYLIGATGTGKTTLLRHLMLSDCRRQTLPSAAPCAAEFQGRSARASVSPA